ncbi:molybdopterin-dependent oxidoreductase [Acidocella sp.]|jgi:DMSO/TMAO reductase YedYZ molybdopterin-dependent catalytic subunit|uniref:molybdopterin-dependent oxidoreductase n=1 Tax=Acidocella sp. TaxID=50710 RepID=UPI002F417BF6
MPSPIWLITLLPLLAAGAFLFFRARLLTRYPALRAILTHRRWSRLYAWQHGAFILSFPLLMLTGTALYFEAWHRALIAWLSQIQTFHSWFGLAFAAVIVVAALGAPVAPKRPRWFDWLLTGFLTMVVTLSGVALWKPQLVPGSWDAVAFSVHGWASYAWLAWILIHAALRLISFQAKHPLNARFDYRRREVLLTTAGMAVVGSQLLNFAGRQIQDAAIAEAAPTGARGAPKVPVFPAYYTFTDAYPDIKPADYRLTVEGLVDHPLTLTLDEMQKIGPETARRNFVCVTGWSVSNISWTGVSLATLMKLAGAHPEATHIIFHSADGTYVDQLSVKDAMLPGMMLAYQIDGQPLLREGGYPVRLIVPPMYGYKSVKWVNRVVLASDGVVGTWERYGYADAAWLPGQQTV